MGELALRLMLAAGAAAMQPQMLGPAAGLYAASVVVAALFQRRGIWKSEVAALFAAADCAIIGSVLAATKTFDSFGFAALIPIFWARFKHQANWWTSIAGALALVGGSLAVRLSLPGMTEGIQALAVLGLGLVPIPEPQMTIVEPEFKLEDLVADYDEIELKLVEEPRRSDAELRATYKDLKNKFDILEGQSRRDRFANRALRAYLEAVDNPFSALAINLMDDCGAEGLTLYAMPPTKGRLVVQSVSGRVPEKVLTESFDAPGNISEGQLKHKLHQLTNALRDPHSMLTHGSVVLKNRGRVVGLVSLFHSNSRELDDCVAKAELAAESLGALMVLHMERQSLRRRAGMAELLHAAASAVDGATSLATLSERLIRDLWPLLDLDHLSINLIEEGAAKSLASDGADVDPLAPISFGFGPGLGGWLRSGAPELAMLDARTDLRLERDDAIRLRLGSIVIQPLGAASAPMGYFCATSHRVNGIGDEELSVLRAIAADLGRAMMRLARPRLQTEGLATPAEFRSALASADLGSLVQIEPLKINELREQTDVSAIETALRSLALRLKNSLPPGGVICRRETGSFAVLLRGWTEVEASRWANEAVTAASFIAVTSKDGRRLPLAVRARAAALPERVTNTPKVHA
jgi:hypothetical protein